MSLVFVTKTVMPRMDNLLALEYFAGQQRFRRIKLTTATTTVGLVPLWIGGGIMWEFMVVQLGVKKVVTTWSQQKEQFMYLSLASETVEAYH